MKYLFILFLFIPFTMQSLTAQNAEASDDMESLPYESIGEYPEAYTPATVAARMIDGLGYRYYWATEGLREEDLAYKPSEKGRTTFETLQHVYGLSGTILNASKNIPNIRPAKDMPKAFADLRKATLINLKEASDILKANPDTDLEELKMIFKRGDNATEFPYWNMINGPIADAIYHAGQVVSFRRSSGNPQNPKVNVLMGKTRE